ncbi:hypothetical protein ACWDD4_43045, partial [Streptomyces sp. NPDC001205]
MRLTDGAAGGDVRGRLPTLDQQRQVMGEVVTVLDKMGIFEDDSEPSSERWLAERLEGLAPGIRSEAERWTRVLRDGGPRSLPRRYGRF